MAMIAFDFRTAGDLTAACVSRDQPCASHRLRFAAAGLRRLRRSGRSKHGSGRPRSRRGGGIHCPIQFHFGESTCPEGGRIQSAMTGRENASTAGAGHTDNHEAAMFHNPDAAKAAWSLTAGFLERHLPTN
jgi:hypothetical protein